MDPVFNAVLFSIFGVALVWVLGLVVWPDAGCNQFLTTYITDRLATSNVVFRVYTNPQTPGPGDTLTNYTEATWAGYNPVPGSAITWAAPTVTAHKASSTGSPITFVNSSAAAVTLYGIFVTDGTKANLLFAEKDANSPVSIPAGGSYIYTPNQQFASMN